MQLILELQQVGQWFAEAATDARDAFFQSGEQTAVLELHNEIVLSGARLQGELTNTSDDPEDEASETYRAKLLIQLAFLVRCREATIAEHEKAAGFWSSLLGEETDTSELDAQIEWLREMVVTPLGDDPDGTFGDAEAVDTETSSWF